MNVTESRISKTLLPKTLQTALKDYGYTKNDIRFCIYHSAPIELPMYNTQWSDGSRNEYRVSFVNEWHFPRVEGFEESLPYTQQSEEYRGRNLVVNSYEDKKYSRFILITSVFCGKECDPEIHILDEDVAQFFGIGAKKQHNGFLIPKEHLATPSAIQADWLEENDERIKHECGSHEAGRIRKVVNAIRKANGV